MHDKQKNKNKTKQDKQTLAKYNNNHAVFCHPRTDILPAPVQIAKYMIGRLLVYLHVVDTVLTYLFLLQLSDDLLYDSVVISCYCIAMTMHVLNGPSLKTPLLINSHVKSWSSTTKFSLS